MKCDLGLSPNPAIATMTPVEFYLTDQCGLGGIGQQGDTADDQGTPLPPFGTGGSGGVPNSGANEGDYNAFFAGFFDALNYCDIADDAGNPLPSAGNNNGVNEGDYNCFFAYYFSGCS